MRYRLILFLLTLASALWADSMQMWQPRPILSTVPTLHVTAVTLGEEETVVVLGAQPPISSHLSSLIPHLSSAACASDEADHHYPLLRTAQTDSTLTLVFSALPQDTRLLDVVIDSTHRWMGIHSGIRALRLPAAHPQFDADATVPDSINDIIQANTLEEMLTDDTLYAFVRQQLPLFRDYVAWKWKLAPHEAFLLQREHEHLEQMRNGQTASGTHDPAQPHDSVPLPPIRRQLPHGPKPPRPNLLQRLFGHKEEGTPPNSKRPRPVSHFEQKMLQEMRK